MIGSATALVVSLGRDPYREHTWVGITDNGMLYNHDPFGDTLYCVDVNVHPDHRRQGVGTLLYDARKALCRRLNLSRLVAGARVEEARMRGRAPRARRVLIQADSRLWLPLPGAHLPWPLLPADLHLPPPPIGAAA